MEKDLAALIDEIGGIRAELEDAARRIDPGNVIYPGWTIKEVIGHITAWEIVIDKALKAYLKGDPPYFLHEQDFDLFNQEVVDFRGDWSLEEVFKEWNAVRDELIKTIRKFKIDDLDVEMVLPWGSERTVTELIEIAGEHESEHMEDVKRVAS